MFRQLSVHLLPDLCEPAELTGGVAIVLDVLRASTTIITALAAGAAAVVPCADVDEARRAAARLPGGTALLGGERFGVKIPGFDLDNSPASYSPERVAGKVVVFTTTNGTRALVRAQTARRVLVGAFVNLHAVAQVAIDSQMPVHVVCAGTDGQITAEDALCAGAIGSIVQRAVGDVSLNDSAWLAVSLFEQQGRSRSAFDQVLRDSRGGRNLLQLGFGGDIDIAASFDTQALVPELAHDPWSLRPCLATPSTAHRWIDPPG